jgi:hypothetical protein
MELDALGVAGVLPVPAANPAILRARVRLREEKRPLRLTARTALVRPTTPPPTAALAVFAAPATFEEVFALPLDEPEAWGLSVTSACFLMGTS